MLRRPECYKETSNALTSVVVEPPSPTGKRPGPEGRVRTSRRSRPSKQRHDAVCLRETAGRVRTSRRSRPSKQRHDAVCLRETTAEIFPDATRRREPRMTGPG
jgi:hypothetical protein